MIQPTTRLPSPRQVAWRAFHAGSLLEIILRSGRSGAATVLVCGFGSYARACRFAARVAPLVGRSVAVRRPYPREETTYVSVPVDQPHTTPPYCSGLCQPVSGGVRAFAYLLFRTGIRSMYHRPER